MKLARSLQKSGSDIVIEEDLATIFGRCQIDTQMERSFRIIVGRHKSHNLIDALGLALEDGRGPTVHRSLTQTQYLAMIIQCSLLIFVHEKSSLAAAIALICEKEAENVEHGQTARAVPSHEGLYGVLQASEDQTSSFDWSGLLFATARALDISEDDVFIPIPSIVLQGAVLVLPMVQRFPEDRIVMIDASLDAGACSLVVWTHHVLGLNVLVRKNDSQDQLVEKQFGQGANHVIVDLWNRSFSWVGKKFTSEVRQPSVTLLSVSDSEPLLTLRPEPDEIALDANYKLSARGYGRKILDIECAKCGGEEGRDVFMRELTLVVVAFAAVILQHFSRIPRSAFDDNILPIQECDISSTVTVSTRGSSVESSTDHDIMQKTDEKCLVSEQALVSSTCFLFNIPQFNMKLIDGHVLAFSGRPLDLDFLILHSISLLFDQYPSRNKKRNSLWQDMLRNVRYLSVVLLSFTFVGDLDGVADLPLSQSLDVLCPDDLVVQLNSWDGVSQIWIPEDSWFLVLARLLVGYKSAIDLSSTCLISDRGWSIFMSTFGDGDPTSTDAGYIVIKKGVPCRDGVRKHSIQDGPPGSFGDKWHIHNVAGAQESLPCVNTVYRSKPLCGDRHSSFHITLRLSTELALQPGQHKRTWSKHHSRQQVQSRRTGYRELFAAIWVLLTHHHTLYHTLHLTLHPPHAPPHALHAPRAPHAPPTAPTRSHSLLSLPLAPSRSYYSLSLSTLMMTKETH